MSSRLKLEFQKNLLNICVGVSEEFAQYLRYARRLDFFETPDYEYCYNLFKSVLDRLGYAYDYEFDWTPKLNQVSTPSGSLHAGDAHKAEGKRAGGIGKGRQDDTLRPSSQTPGGGIQQGGGFGSTQVINSNAGEMIEDNGGRSQQPITRIEESSEVK
ncbi:unnamed protein product [Gongylonema pulchrum]|uniref:Non-specific serine/threonine protein kinase n=1 Tax=Gongylonema pulchrum TaxID=637853 RepID=A0A183E5U2_9BILA|nr:unnamed protein product [Gongylonema pulchrum]